MQVGYDQNDDQAIRAQTLASWLEFNLEAHFFHALSASSQRKREIDMLDWCKYAFRAR